MIRCRPNRIPAMIPGSRLVDAPPAGLTLADVAPMAADYELVVMHTSTPSFVSDASTVRGSRWVTAMRASGYTRSRVGRAWRCTGDFSTQRHGPVRRCRIWSTSLCIS